MAKKVKKKKAKKAVLKRKAVQKKKTVKRVVRKKKSAVKKTKKTVVPPSPTAGLEVIGGITHYFPHVSAGVIKLKKSLSVGEEVYIKGHTTDFKQKIESMQINHVIVQSAKAQDEIGILVKNRVRAGDVVYRL